MGAYLLLRLINDSLDNLIQRIQTPTNGVFQLLSKVLFLILNSVFIVALVLTGKACQDLITQRLLSAEPISINITMIAAIVITLTKIHHIKKTRQRKARNQITDSF